MQKSLYRAISSSQYFFSQNQKNNEFQTIKNLFEAQNLHFEVEFSSASIWVLTWNISNNTFSGVLDLSIRPRLVDQNGVVQHEQRYPRTFRVEEPLVEKDLLKEKFLSFVLDEIKSFAVLCGGC